MERGDVILDGLLKTVAGLLVTALVVFEAGAIAVNHVQTHDAARSLAYTASVAMGENATHSRVTSAVEDAAEDHPGVVVRDVHTSSDAVAVTVARDPDVLVIDRVRPLGERLTAEVTETVETR